MGPGVLKPLRLHPQRSYMILTNKQPGVGTVAWTLTCECWWKGIDRWLSRKSLDETNTVLDSNRGQIYPKYEKVFVVVVVVFYFWMGTQACPIPFHSPYFSLLFSWPQKPSLINHGPFSLSAQMCPETLQHNISGREDEIVANPKVSKCWFV